MPNHSLIPASLANGLLVAIPHIPAQLVENLNRIVGTLEAIGNEFVGSIRQSTHQVAWALICAQVEPRFELLLRF